MTFSHLLCQWFFQPVKFAQSERTVVNYSSRNLFHFNLGSVFFFQASAKDDIADGVADGVADDDKEDKGEDEKGSDEEDVDVVGEGDEELGEEGGDKVSLNLWQWVQGWRSGESTRLSLMWIPGLDAKRPYVGWEM